MTIAAEERVKALEERAKKLECELVRELEAEVAALKGNLRTAKLDLETAENTAANAEALADEAEDEARVAYAENYELRRGLESVSGFVWLNDRPGAAYCRACGRTYPIHNHDCPFVEVQ